MTKPTVFISHRHADSAIAEVVAKFVHVRSSGRANVFCSSSDGFVRPTAGDDLDSSLVRALGKSDLVVLIFTTETEDWSWCMWECGVATNPHDERPTKVVVLQCGDAVPKPYGGKVRVDARSQKSLNGFVETLLTTTHYFAKPGVRLTEFSPGSTEIKAFADDLHAKLGEALATLSTAEVEEHSAATYFRIEIDRDAMARLNSGGEGTTSGAAELVRQAARIVDRRGADGLFGFRVESGMTLGALFDRWTRRRREHCIDDPATDRWCDSVIEQIIFVASGQFPVVAWAPFGVEPGKATVPFVAGSRSVPANGGLQLHLYFVPMSPRPVPVVERMTRIEKMFYKTLGETAAPDLGLVELRTEMNANGYSRVPILGKGCVPRFMVHLSLIETFLTDRLLSDASGAMSLTVHDLLKSSRLARTFAVVDRSIDMDRALAAMNAIPGCQDVFVTVDGTAEGAVIGWLTNTDFTS